MWLYLDRPTDELWWGGEPDESELAEVLGGWALSEADADLVLEVWARTCPARRAGTRCYAHNPEADELVAYDAGPRVAAVRALAGALQKGGTTMQSGKERYVIWVGRTGVGTARELAEACDRARTAATDEARWVGRAYWSVCDAQGKVVADGIVHG